MAKKLILLPLIIWKIITTASQPTNREQFAISKYQFHCDSNMLSLMSFRFSHKCVQLVRDNHAMDCTATIMEHSKDVTFYMRSVAWLLNRNILNDESLTNAHRVRNSTRSCENFLIFLDNTTAIKPLVEAIAIDDNATKILFPFSKLYFLSEDSDTTLNRSDLDDLSTVFYKKALFGYIFEFNTTAKKTQLHNLLTNRYIDEPSRGQVNVIHPFVDRRNRNKRFRVRFNNCYPYVIILNATEQRYDAKATRRINKQDTDKRRLSCLNICIFDAWSTDFMSSKI